MTQNPVLKNKILIAIAGTLMFVSLLLGGIFVYQSYFNNQNSLAENAQSSQTQASKNQSSESKSFDLLSESENKAENSGQKSESGSSLSSQKSSQNVSQESKTNELKNSQSSKNSAQVTPQSYTNQYFPNLKINYDSSWKFETSTRETNYPNLLERKITLTKESSQITFVFTPLVPTGCAFFDEGDKPLFTANGINRYRKVWLKDSTDEYYYGTSKCSISNKISSNIKITDVQYKQNESYENYKQLFGDKKYMEYNYSINLKSSNQNLIQQADEIIRNSVFE